MAAAKIFTEKYVSPVGLIEFFIVSIILISFRDNGSRQLFHNDTDLGPRIQAHHVETWKPVLNAINDWPFANRYATHRLLPV